MAIFCGKLRHKRTSFNPVDYMYSNVTTLDQYIDGLAQDCSYSIASALELL